MLSKTAVLARLMFQNNKETANMLNKGNVIVTRQDRKGLG